MKVFFKWLIFFFFLCSTGTTQAEALERRMTGPRIFVVWTYMWLIWSCFYFCAFSNDLLKSLIKHFLVSDHVSIFHQIGLLGVVPTRVTSDNDRSVKQNLAGKAAAENLLHITTFIRGNMTNIRKRSVFRRIMRKYQSIAYS